MITDAKLLKEFSAFCGEERFAAFTQSVRDAGEVNGENKALFDRFLAEREANLQTEVRSAYTEEERNYKFICPEQGCDGIVVLHGEPPNPWGCGHCGTLWGNLAELSDAIDTITNDFPHRGAWYERLPDGSYRPAPPELISPNAPELIESESA